MKNISRNGIKYSPANTSLAAALLGWLLLSSLNLFVIWALRDRSRLIRDNDNERILNTLFTETRNYGDFGSAVEANPVLKERINGAAVYDSELRPAYQWGRVPALFDETILRGHRHNRFGRYTIPDRQGRSAIFVLSYERMPAPMMQMPRGHGMMMRGHERRQEETRQNMEQPPPFLSDFFGGRYFYIDISHLDFWRTRTLTAVLFPLGEIALLFLMFYIRRLYLRNREYREKIEAQQNLVVLGTAAGTLAHEIKNPLLSIRLQTGILEKTSGGQCADEIGIINQEVDRLSALVYRVNDYLRDPSGQGEPVDMRALLSQTASRVCGADISRNAVNDSAPALVFADENRIRSVLENILRNAAESGSRADEIGAVIAADENTVTVTVFDRGRGIAEKDITRVFDPFFTSKSAGTGIGLAVGKRFTEAAGGSITIKNRAGGGVEAVLAFPRYRS